MASTNKTSLGLNHWVDTDRPKMEDFNNDNDILTAAIAGLQSNPGSAAVSVNGIGSVNGDIALSAADIPYKDGQSVEGALDDSGVRQDAALQEFMNDFKTQSENDFRAWFASLQNTLGENSAGNLLNLITDLSARVDLLEGILLSDIRTNPFLIQFASLEGITATGVWNQALQRIEC